MSVVDIFLTFRDLVMATCRGSFHKNKSEKCFSYAITTNRETVLDAYLQTMPCGFILNPTAYIIVYSIQHALITKQKIGVPKQHNPCLLYDFDSAM